jgi:hypothetical protein
MKQAGVRHVEAFCHMTYEGWTPNGDLESLSVWNSRDGVTPLRMRHPETGTSLVHVRWDEDRPDPDHVPAPGDWIFVTGDGCPRFEGPMNRAGRRAHRDCGVCGGKLRAVPKLVQVQP